MKPQPGSVHDCHWTQMSSISSLSPLPPVLELLPEVGPFTRVPASTGVLVLQRGGHDYLDASLLSIFTGSHPSSSGAGTPRR